MDGSSAEQIDVEGGDDSYLQDFQQATKPKRGRKSTKVPGVDPRQMESPLQRMQRLELQRLRAAKSRNCETEEQRLRRLKANRERIARIRSNESEEQREDRLRKQRERIRDLRKIAKDSERKRIREFQKQIMIENREKKNEELESRIRELNTLRKIMKKQQHHIEILVSNSFLPRDDESSLDSHEEAHLDKTDETAEVDVLSNDELMDANLGTRVCIFTVCQKCGANTWNEDSPTIFCKSCQANSEQQDNDNSTNQEDEEGLSEVKVEP